jgi:phage antirepressor YoqD-like protein
MESKNARSEELKEKITCECGAVVIKNNLKAHLLTKKHLAASGGQVVTHRVPKVSEKTSGVKEQAVSKKTSGHKKQSIKWQEPDNDESDDDDELEQAEEEEEGLFEDEVMDVLDLLNQKVDNLINQNLACSIRELYKAIDILGETSNFKQDNIIEILKRIESKMNSLNIPQQPQQPQLRSAVGERANEKCQ